MINGKNSEPRFIPIPVEIPSAPVPGQTQEKSPIITTNNSTTEVSPDQGYLLSKVTVNVAIPTQQKTATITTNGGSVTVTPASGKLLTSAVVTANIPTQQKTAETVTANGTVTITPDSGKLLTKVIVPVSVPTSGGDLPGTITRMTFKTFNGNSSTTSPLVVNHGFGEEPDMILVFWNGNDGGLGGYVAKQLIRIHAYGENKGGFRYSSTGFNNDSIPYMEYDETSITLTPSVSVRFMAGTLYTAVMFKFAASSAASYVRDEEVSV